MEQKWVAQSKKGNMEAFEQLVYLYEKQIYRIAYRYTGNEADARDVTQEAVLQAYRSLGQLKNESAFGVWLKRITQNKCLDLLRNRQKNAALSLDQLQEDAVILPENPAMVEYHTPEKIADEKESVRQIQDMIDQLPWEYREIILLRSVSEYSYEEIAEEKQCALGTVKSRLYRAKKMLAEMMEKRRDMDEA